MSIEESARRVDAWLCANAPEIAESLRPGASEEQLQDLEAALGVELPPDFRRWLAIHDGQEEGYPGLFEGHTLLPVDHILGEWQVFAEVGELVEDVTLCAFPLGVRRVWYDARWIPIAYLGSSEWFVIDLHPAPGGPLGQIFFRAKSGDCDRALPGFGAWLRALADDLEAGRVALDSEGFLERRG